MTTPKDDKLPEIQSSQAEADNAWIKRWGEKYNPESKKLSYDQCYFIQYKADTIPIPPNITEAHRKDLKEWLKDDVKWRKEKKEEEEKAKFEAFYLVFLGLGLILFFILPCVLVSSSAFRSENIWAGCFFLLVVASSLGYSIKRIFKTDIGERGNANRFALMIPALMIIIFCFLILFLGVREIIFVMRK